MAASRKKKPTTKSQVDDENDTADATAPGAARPDEMSADVLEFVTAIDDYKRINRRPFPNWSEVLEILKTLGYQRNSR